MSSVALIWDDALTAYRFYPGHPLDPRRLELTVDLIHQLGLVGGPGRPVIEPDPAGESALRLVHDTEYIEGVQRLSEPGAASDPIAQATASRYGLDTQDTPAVEGMHEMALAHVSATLTGAQLVMSGGARRVFVPSGGLHHADRAYASGFCIYNDLAVAIRWMQREHGARVLYIDVDAHHGDGVQNIFYEDREVLTLSFHESGAFLFPATGFIDEMGVGEGYGHSVNVPLEPYTDDGSWWAAFEALVPEIVHAFGPDVIVLQSGCDGHALDPLTHLEATTGLYERFATRLVALAEEYCEGRLLVTGGGGYAIYTVVPRAWTLVWGALCGEPVSDEIPEAWLEAVRHESGVDVPTTLRDPPDPAPVTERGLNVEQENARIVQEVRRRVLPLLSRRGMV